LKGCTTNELSGHVRLPWDVPSQDLKKERINKSKDLPKTKDKKTQHITDPNT